MREGNILKSLPVSGSFGAIAVDFPLLLLRTYILASATMQKQKKPRLVSFFKASGWIPLTLIYNISGGGGGGRKKKNQQKRVFPSRFPCRLKACRGFLRSCVPRCRRVQTPLLNMSNNKKKNFSGHFSSNVTARQPPSSGSRGGGQNRARNRSPPAPGDPTTNSDWCYFYNTRDPPEARWCSFLSAKMTLTLHLVI